MSEPTTPRDVGAFRAVRLYDAAGRSWIDLYVGEQHMTMLDYDRLWASQIEMALTIFEETAQALGVPFHQETIDRNGNRI